MSLKTLVRKINSIPKNIPINHKIYLEILDTYKINEDEINFNNIYNNISLDNDNILLHINKLYIDEKIDYSSVTHIKLLQGNIKYYDKKNNSMNLKSGSFTINNCTLSNNNSNELIYMSLFSKKSYSDIFLL